MRSEGWAGDPTNQPWWMFFILLGACTGVAIIALGAYMLVEFVAKPVAPFTSAFLVAGLILVIKRSLQWMYGPNLGQSEPQRDEPRPREPTA